MMEQLSAEYGWTPNQIRRERYSDIMSYWDILQEKRKIAKEKQPKIKKR